MHTGTDLLKKGFAFVPGTSLISTCAGLRVYQKMMGIQAVDQDAFYEANDPCCTRNNYDNMHGRKPS